MLDEALKVCEAYNTSKRRLEILVHDIVSHRDPVIDEKFWKNVKLMNTSLVTRGMCMTQIVADQPIYELAARGNIARFFTKESWLDAATFVKSYGFAKRNLHDMCFKMLGVEKGDDSFGDWIDSLPLAGYEVYARIMNEDIATYKQVENAIRTHAPAWTSAPALVKFIQDGENYVEMKLHEALADRLGGVVFSLKTPPEERIF